jgi:hypothetical protein
VNQPPTDIPPANRNAFLPSVAVADDGTIGVSYYDFRYNDAAPGLPTDYWLVRCRPLAGSPATDPASWSSEVRLTDSSFNIEGAPTAVTASYFIGDYEGLTTAGNDFLAAWSQPHDTDLDSVFFRRAYGDGTLNDGPLNGPANLSTLTTGSSGLAVDTYFMDPTRTNQAASNVTNSDTTPGHSFGLPPSALLGATDLLVPTEAGVSDTPASTIMRWPDYGPALDWTTDFLALCDLSLDLDEAGWHAG